MRRKTTEISFPRVFKIVGVICGVALLISLVWTAIIWQKQTSQAKQLAQVQANLAESQKRLYERQSAGIFGGKTPAETIYLYYEFLESRDFPVLSTYFVPEKRVAELSRFDGVSEKEILAFVEELRASEVLAKKAERDVSTYSASFPVEMGLKKMENGVWEFEYIYRKLK